MSINRKARRRANKIAMTREERKRVQGIGVGPFTPANRIDLRQAIIQPALKRATAEVITKRNEAEERLKRAIADAQVTNMERLGT